ncbi:MAG: GPR1/FUN34/YaaH family transporter [Bacillota bacterium]|nr:GPR1/FUN34/YaaH family transporter [Bacillota bacterium]
MGKEMTWANPATAGIVGLCTVVIPLAILNLGWIPAESAPLIIGWLIFGGLVQVIAGIIEFKRGGLLFATPLLVFGLMLCITPAFGEITKIWIKDFAVPPAANGVGFLVVAVYVAAFFIATGLVSRLIFALCLLLDLGLWLVGLAAVGVLVPAAGAVGWFLLLIFALGMLYVACALFLNELFERQVLPIGAPLFTKGAVSKGKNVSA